MPFTGCLTTACLVSYGIGSNAPLLNSSYSFELLPQKEVQAPESRDYPVYLPMSTLAPAHCDHHQKYAD